MLEFLGWLTNDILNPFGIWVGIIMAVPVFWTWYDVVWGRRFRHKRWLERARNATGALPAILIVDLLPGKNVRTAVERFCAQDAGLNAIPKDRIFTVSRNSWLAPDDAAEFVKDIQDVAAEILRSGADVLHFFHAGPVFAAAVVGAEFANASCRVLLYQNEQGKYINFGPLRHVRF